MNKISYQRKILITGGAGFIGSNLIRFILETSDHIVINVDKLTYAGNLDSLKDIESNANYCFERLDIADAAGVQKVFETHRPDWVMNLAAESHVDRSIDEPGEFIQTNIVGTYNLLQSSLFHWRELPTEKKDSFRFHHVSTDEVFGSLEKSEPAFAETTGYDPHSPYSASKACSDHLVRAWHSTFGLPTLITNCSNNYGPYQFPEKLIPVVILRAIQAQPIPVYGDGENVRDWLYVNDHAKALVKVLNSGRVGESYNIGGNNERTNIELVRLLCTILDELLPIASNPKINEEKKSQLTSYADLITFVNDRPGHDFRYAINSAKIQNELSWVPEETPQSGFEKTVRWYLENRKWWSEILSGDYKLGRQGTL